MTKGMHYRPFRNLRDLLQANDVRLEEMPAVRLPGAERQHLTPQQEDALFRQAMADVRPLTPVKTVSQRPRLTPSRPYPSEELEALNQLRCLVECGRGYRVADTPEYIEGKGVAVSDELVRRLHRGAFSIQGHVDLHGMGVKEARAAVDHLLSVAIHRGWRMLLIIHGRGLSSPDEPVLKSRLVQWFNSGAWRRWIMAYASARPCDGGAGATYVLLRRRPMKKCRRRGHLPKGAPS